MPVLHRSFRPKDRDHETREALDDAREALAYWEDRAGRLPRRAVRSRREAQEHVRRWEARVAERERERYGEGVAGALVLLATERRLPHVTRRAGGRVVRRARRTLTVIMAGAIAFTVAAVVILIDVALRLVQAVG